MWSATSCDFPCLARVILAVPVTIKIPILRAVKQEVGGVPNKECESAMGKGGGPRRPGTVCMHVREQVQCGTGLRRLGKEYPVDEGLLGMLEFLGLQELQLSKQDPVMQWKTTTAFPAQS